jgi:hypothetical protein
MSTKGRRGLTLLLVIPIVIGLTYLGHARATANPNVTSAQTAQSPSRITPLSSYQRKRGLTQQNHLHHPAGTIVGSQTPDLIPTDEAVATMLRTLAGLAADDKHGPALLTAYFRRIQLVANQRLTDVDKDLIRGSAIAYANATRIRTATRSGISPKDFANARRVSAANEWNHLRNSLSPDGRTGLELYVERYMKSHIKLLKN